MVITDLKVFVLEDEPVVSDILKRGLNRSGITNIDIAANPAEADKFIPNNYDVVLLDTLIGGVMPNDNKPYGPETLDKITKAGKKPKIVIATSGDPYNKRLWNGKPITYFLEKPFSFKELIRLIKEHFPD